MGLKVLVVDDAAFVRDTIKRMLRQFIPEVEIFEAQDGRRAVAAIKSKGVQLILSDWEMPEMSGAELLQWLRESDFKELPFLMISSRGDRDHVLEAVQSGVSDYLTKPFTPEELKKKVFKQLKRIGYVPKSRPAPRVSDVSPFASAEVLTSAKVDLVSKPTMAVQAASAFARPDAQARPAAKVKKGNFEGKAQCRFPNITCQCVIHELSLQGMSGFMVRPETLPTLFDQAVVDMENARGEAIARVNGYVDSLVALEKRPDTNKIKITIRFVDNDPDKFEALSKAIAG